MRFLANENVAAEAVDGLRAAGHDVLWIRTDAPGASDPRVLAAALADGRVLITFDKDFGEMTFRAGLPATCGVMLFRVRQLSGEYVARHVLRAVQCRSDWAGFFSVIDEAVIRMTPLPGL